MMLVRALGMFLGILLLLPGTVVLGQEKEIKLLHIGTSGSLDTGTNPNREKAALELLHDFIKSETGFENQIDRFKGWQEQLDALANGKLHLSVFRGYEFAWAQKKQSELKPLVLGVNIHRYAEVYVVVRKDSPATAVAGLRGQTLALPPGGLSKLFVERQLEQKPEQFFARITSPATVEDALDDIVDGVVQAAAVDRASLEAYRRRKPARFNQLKSIAHSPPVPLVVIAYHDARVDAATLQRFRTGLLNASQKEKGQTLLNLFRLTGFQEIPKDFPQVLETTGKTFPPPRNGIR
jgi:ABC-type phosphate/phosphonate transport system substrate-binding protein